MASNIEPKQTFQLIVNTYDKFVKENPRLAADLEAITRWSSYLVGSRKSPILGELLSSSADLLQLCNDIILRKELGETFNDCVTKLRTFLNVINSLELLAEIYARDTYGAIGKWTFISIIQVTKAVIRLVLLLVYDQGLTKSISPIDRTHYSEIIKLRKNLANKNAPAANETKSVVLPSSGRRIRSITDSPPRDSRFTSGPFDELQKQRLTMLLERYKEQRSASLTERQLYGELLYIARPVAHLALMGTFGTKSWISYFSSMAMDVSSLYLVRDGDQPFNMNERLELGQRASSLLLYLLRSPFFDEYTKQKALEGIGSTAQKIPLFGNFLATFVDYIPDWQKDYFRVWSA